MKALEKLVKQRKDQITKHFEQMDFPRDVCHLVFDTQEPQAHEPLDKYRVDLRETISADGIATVLSQPFDVFNISDDEILNAREQIKHDLQVLTQRELKTLDELQEIIKESNIIAKLAVPKRDDTNPRHHKRLEHRISASNLQVNQNTLRRFAKLNEHTVKQQQIKNDIPENQTACLTVKLTNDGLRKANNQQLEQALKLYKETGSIAELCKYYDKTQHRDKTELYHHTNKLSSLPCSNEMVKQHDEHKDPLLIQWESLHYQYQVDYETLQKDINIIEQLVADDWETDSKSIDTIPNAYLAQTPHTNPYKKWGLNTLDQIKRLVINPPYDLSNELDEQELILRYLNLCGVSYNTHLEIELYCHEMDFLRVHRPYVWTMVMTHFIPRDNNDLPITATRYSFSNGSYNKSYHINPETYQDDTLRTLQFEIEQTSVDYLPDEIRPLDFTKIANEQDIINKPYETLDLETRQVISYWHGLKHGDFDMDYLTKLANGEINPAENILTLASETNKPLQFLRTSAQKVVKLQNEYAQIRTITNKHHAMMEHIHRLHTLTSLYKAMGNTKLKGNLTFRNLFPLLQSELTTEYRKLLLDSVNKSYFTPMYLFNMENPSVEHYQGKFRPLSLTKQMYHNYNGEFNSTMKEHSLSKHLKPLLISEKQFTKLAFYSDFTQMVIMNYMNVAEPMQQFLHNANIKSTDDMINYYKIYKSLDISYHANGKNIDDLINTLSTHKPRKEKDPMLIDYDLDDEQILTDDELEQLDDELLVEQVLPKHSAHDEPIELDELSDDEHLALTTDDWEMLRTIQRKLNNKKSRGDIQDSINAHVKLVQSRQSFEIDDILNNLQSSLNEIYHAKVNPNQEQPINESNQEFIRADDDAVIGDIGEIPTVSTNNLSSNEILELANAVIPLKDINQQQALEMLECAFENKDKLTNPNIIAPQLIYPISLLTADEVFTTLTNESVMTFDELINHTPSTEIMLCRLTKSNWASSDLTTLFSKHYFNLLNVNKLGAIVNHDEHFNTLSKDIINDYNYFFNSGLEQLNRSTIFYHKKGDYDLVTKLDPLTNTTVIDIPSYTINIDGADYNTDKLTDDDLKKINTVDLYVYENTTDDEGECISFNNENIQDLKGFHPLTYDTYYLPDEFQEIFTMKLKASIYQLMKDKGYDEQKRKQLADTLNSLDDMSAIKKYLKLEHIMALIREIRVKQYYIKQITLDNLCNGGQTNLLSARLGKLMYWLYESMVISLNKVLENYNLASAYHALKDKNPSDEQIAQHFILKPTESVINEVVKMKELFENLNQTHNPNSHEWYYKLTKENQELYTRLGLWDNANWEQVDENKTYLEHYTPASTDDYKVSIEYASDMYDFQSEPPKPETIYQLQVTDDLQNHWNNQI